MITPFIGEFLIHPAPIDCSGNTCSHNCLYCFANNRRGCRIDNLKSTINLLKKYPQSKSYTGALIREGYPFCLSNISDPFSKTNIEQTKGIFQYLNNMPNGIFFQTKGGDRIHEAIELIKEKKNVVFYFTITTLNDELSKKIEPGAPVSSERIKMAYELKKQGYEIIIAINPCVKEWITENEIIDFAIENKKHGITHYIFQQLHLGKEYKNDKISKLPNGKQTVETGLNHNKKPYTGQLYVQKIVMRLINEVKVNALWFGMPYNTDFFTDINKKLGKSFPSLYHFFNHCVNNDLKEVFHSDYIQSLSVGNESFFNKEFTGIPAYIFRINRGLWKNNPQVQGLRTINDLLKIFWNEKRLANSPQNNFVMFEKTDQKDNEGNIILKRKQILAQPDENGSFANCKL